MTFFTCADTFALLVYARRSIDSGIAMYFWALIALIGASVLLGLWTGP